MRKLFVPLVLLLVSTVACAEMKYYYNETGQCIGGENIPGYKDPRTTITEEDMKGMVYVSPEQKRKMDEKIFKEALENEITARMYQDRVATREQAIKDILSGVPRKVR